MTDTSSNPMATKYRYTIILERFAEEDYGPEATADHGDDGETHHDGSDEAARAQVAHELQEAMDQSGLPVGFFDVIKREKIEDAPEPSRSATPELRHRGHDEGRFHGECPACQAFVDLADEIDVANRPADTPPRSATPEPTDPNVIESDTKRLHREFGYLLDMYGHRKDESGHWANCRDIINDLARSVPPSECHVCGNHVNEAVCMDCWERGLDGG